MKFIVRGYKEPLDKVAAATHTVEGTRDECRESMLSFANAGGFKSISILCVER